MFLDGSSHDLQGEVGIVLGDAHWWFHAEYIAGKAALANLSSKQGFHTEYIAGKATLANLLGRQDRSQSKQAAKRGTVKAEFKSR